MGRTSKESQIIKRIPYVEELASRGLNNIEIAKALGIGKSTFYKHLKNIPEFSNAISKGNSRAVKNVENAMYLAATGFQYDEVTYIPATDETGEIQFDEKGEQVMVKHRVVTKTAKPDTVAGMKLLARLAPEKWGDLPKLPTLPEIIDGDDF